MSIGFYSIIIYSESSGNIGLKRGARQLGWRLEDGDHIDSGIGPKFMTNFSSRFRMPEPTQTFDQEKDFDIAGCIAYMKYCRNELMLGFNFWFAIS